MNRPIFYFFFGVLLMTVGGVLDTGLELEPFHPNLLVPLVIYLGLTMDITAGLLVCALLGHSYDLYSSFLPGMHTVLFGVGFLLLHKLQDLVDLAHPLFIIAGTLITMAMLVVSRTVLTVTWLPHGSVYLTDLWPAVLWHSLVTALCAYPVFRITAWVDQLLFRRRSAWPSSPE